MEHNDPEAEKERKSKSRIISSIVNIAENVLSRQRKIGDPVLRHSLFLDKLLLMLDISMGILQEFSNEYPEELRGKIETLSISIQKDLSDLMNWVSNPVYSPDHPYGQGIMKSAKKDFTKHSTDDDGNS